MILPLISVPLPLDQARSIATKRCPRWGAPWTTILALSQ